MQKRTIVFGKYDTALHGWTLTGYKLSDPEQKTNYVEKPGGDGSWDLSTVMTDGLPRYKNRTLTATFECSEGTRADREELISDMVNRLDGLEHDIVLPDHVNYFIPGRVHVAVNYSDLAHASVTVTGTCAPWLYRKMLTEITVDAAEENQTLVLHNSGRLAMVPKITVAGDSPLIIISYNSSSEALTTGEYEWPTLLLTPGKHSLGYKGVGKITFTYREAVLR